MPDGGGDPVARTGCQWRYLPGRYGRWNSVWAHLWRWRRTGVWATAIDRLRREVRGQAGRDPEPSLVMIDAQVAKGRRAGPGFHTRGGIRNQHPPPQLVAA